MKFTKAQVNGNDFVIIDGCSRDCSIDLKLIANRRFGVGCDQIIFIDVTPDSQYSIEFFNQDGANATMCGNGSCAIATYIRNVLADKSTEFMLKISGNAYRVKANKDTSTVFFEMPQYIGEQNLENIRLVSTGNKHLIYNTKSVLAIEDGLPEALQTEYPEYNIHFVYTNDSNGLRIRSFERGVGWTKACGTGAIAAFFAFGGANATTTKILHEGGTSIVSIIGNEVSLTTKPKLVFSGILY